MPQLESLHVLIEQHCCASSQCVGSPAASLQSSQSQQDPLKFIFLFRSLLFNFEFFKKTFLMRRFEKNSNKTRNLPICEQFMQPCKVIFDLWYGKIELNFTLIQHGNLPDGLSHKSCLSQINKSKVKHAFFILIIIFTSPNISTRCTSINH